jgi:hypothetical protein
MELRSQVKFIFQDLLAARARLELTVGALSIASGAAVLLFVLSFTHGVYRFVDSRFHGAKPVIGSVFVRLKSGEQFSKSQVQEIREFAEQHPDVVESVSWYCGRIDLQVKRNREMETAEQPVVWAFPYDHCSVLDPSNGIRFINGQSLSPANGNAEPVFGVLVNVRFLEDFLSFTEGEIKEVLKGNLKLLPTEIWFHFPPIRRIDGYPRYEPREIAVPVSGVVCLRDEIFPHLFVSPEIAGAFFYEDRQRWEPSYVLQFEKANGGGPLIPKTDYTTDEGLDTIDRRGREWVELPDSKKLRDLDSILTSDKTPFQSAIFLLRNFRRPGLRSEIKRRMEQPKELYRSAGEEKDKLLEMLERKQTRGLRRWLENPIGMKKELSSTEEGFKDRTRGNLTIENRQGVWVLYDSDSGVQHRISTQNNEIVVVQDKPWDVVPPSDTVSEALNQITGLVGFYSNIVSWTIGLLSTLTALLLGIGHIRRKRKDIGILKASGINPFVLAVIYGTQVLCVCIAGATLGVGLAWIVAPFLESSAQALIGDFQLDFTFTESVMVVGHRQIFETLRWVTFGALLGIILPCWQAMTVNPMEDLRTGL